MTYNLNDYRHVVKPQIKVWVEAKPDSPLLKEISLIALATSCPIVVVCYLVGELYGITPELTHKIQKLETFYKVVEIQGKEQI